MSATGTSSRAFAKTQRFPILVGTAAYRKLVTWPSVFLVASSAGLTLDFVVRGKTSWVVYVAAAYSALLAIAFCSPFALIGWIRAVFGLFADAYGDRACDLEVTGDALHVVGGPFHGRTIPFDRLTASGAITFAKSELTLSPKGEHRLWFGSKDPDESASLEALARSLQATVLARGGGAHETPASDRAVPDVLRCKGCGAPLVPANRSVLTCAFCTHDNHVDAELAAKLQTAALVDARLVADRSVCRTLEAEPTARVANLIAFAGGTVAIILTVVLSLLDAVMLFDIIDASGPPPPLQGIGLIGSGLAVLVLGYARRALAGRTAMRVLTLGFSAIPPERTGAPPSCRNCGAPLPESGGHALARCVWCGADNFTPVDLGFEASVIRAFSAGELTLSHPFDRVRREELRARIAAVTGFSLIVAGVLWRAVALH